MFYVAVTTIRGATTSITNPIIQYFEGALRLIRSSQEPASAWYYDASSDTIRNDGQTSTGMAAELGNFLGDDYTTAVSGSDVTVTKDEIVGKFI